MMLNLLFAPLLPALENRFEEGAIFKIDPRHAKGLGTEKVNKATSPSYYLSACAIFQNEADYLKEWVEFHKLMGVEHFWLYNNLSTDNYLEVLDPYIKRGEVELIEWPYTQFPACQLTAYEDGIARTSGKTRWLAVIDIDEFFVPHHHDNLIAFLLDFESFGQILINWQFFGTSHIKSLPKGALLTEHLVRKFPEQFHSTWNSNLYAKAIVDPKLVIFPVISAHNFDLLPGCITVNSAGQSMSPFPITPAVVVNDIQINHYWFKTLDYFYTHKIKRRENITNEKYSPQLIKWLLKNGNSQMDLSVQRFVPALKKRMKH